MLVLLRKESCLALTCRALILEGGTQLIHGPILLSLQILSYWHEEMSPGQKSRPSWDVRPPSPRGTRSPHELRYPHPTDKDTEASTASPAPRTPQLEGDGAQIQGVGLRNLLPNPGTPSHPGSSSLAWDLWAPLGVTGWATRPHSLLAEHHTYILRGEDPQHFGEAHALTEEPSYTPHFPERLRCGSGLGSPQPARRSPSYRSVHTSIPTQSGAPHCSARSTHRKVSGPTCGPPGMPPRSPRPHQGGRRRGRPRSPFPSAAPLLRSRRLSRPRASWRLPPAGNVPWAAASGLLTTEMRPWQGSSPSPRPWAAPPRTPAHAPYPLSRGGDPRAAFTLGPQEPGAPAHSRTRARLSSGHVSRGRRIAAPPDRPGGADVSVAFRRASPHAHSQLPTSPATFTLSQAGGWGRNLRFKI